MDDMKQGMRKALLAEWQANAVEHASHHENCRCSKGTFGAFFRDAVKPDLMSQFGIVAGSDIPGMLERSATPDRLVFRRIA